MSVVFAANLRAWVDCGPRLYSEQGRNQGVSLGDRFLQMGDVAGDGKDGPMGTLLAEHHPVNCACGVGNELGDDRCHKRCTRSSIRRNQERCAELTSRVINGGNHRGRHQSGITLLDKGKRTY